MIAVDSGDTTSAMPSPISAMAGNTASQKSWNPLPTAMASPAKDSGNDEAARRDRQPRPDPVGELAHGSRQQRDRQPTAAGR